MARDFYPFVEKDPSTSDSSQPRDVVKHDDAAAAPRVVMVEPKDVRSFLEEITATVNRLSHEQGGTIPFMVIREIVENFIHAYFKAPTITILDGGNTIRFSDQGPGIKQKDLALEYGTSSATEEMKHYIRGVGSGLPYAQQYMVPKGRRLAREGDRAGGAGGPSGGHPPERPRALRPHGPGKRPRRLKRHVVPCAAGPGRPGRGNKGLPEVPPDQLRAVSYRLVFNIAGKLSTIAYTRRHWL